MIISIDLLFFQRLFGLDFDRFQFNAVVELCEINYIHSETFIRSILVKGFFFVKITTFLGSFNRNSGLLL